MIFHPHPFKFSTIYLILGSQFDHSSMGILVVKNMKHLLINLLMTLESLKTETSKTTTKNQTCDFLRFSKEERNRIGAHEFIWARRGAELSINTGKSARDE